MTNRQRYKQAFSALQISDRLILEVKQMEGTKKQNQLQRVAVAMMACIILLGSVSVAYASDVGGIQRTIQLWIHGDQTMVTLELLGDGTYSLAYTDENGASVQKSGGGVYFALDGTEMPASNEDLEALLDGPEVEYDENGSVWIYWREGQLEVTDLFVDDICYVKLVSGDDVVYVTIKYQNGYAYSYTRYPNPSSFND